MAVREIYGNPVRVAMDFVGDTTEKINRTAARRRRLMYEDGLEQTLLADLQRVIGDRTRRDRINTFARFSGSINLYRRVVDDIAGPVYATPPTRRTAPDGDESALKMLADECELDARMALACALAHATPGCALFYRYVQRLERVVVHVIPRDCITVIPDPDDPTRPLGAVYDRVVSVAGKPETHYVFWDKDEAFEINTNGSIVRQFGASSDDTSFRLRAGAGHPEVFPFVFVRASVPSVGFWDERHCAQLEAAQGAISATLAMALRLVKAQGHTQLLVDGDPANFPKGQVLDPENPIFAGEGNTIATAHNPTDPGNHLKIMEAVQLAAAANYGLNRDHLNATVRAETDLVALLERRQRAVRVMVRAETEGFSVLKAVSAGHKDAAKRLGDDAVLKADFAEISHKVDRAKLLEIWKSEWGMGLSNPLDAIRSDNPEIRTDDEAMKELERNTEAYAKVVELVRKLNIRTDGAPADPSQSSRQNGAMGPPVRDGKMTRDEADEAARTGKPATS